MPSGPENELLDQKIEKSRIFEKKACDRWCFWNTLLLDPKIENSPTLGYFENLDPHPQLDIKFLNL